MSNTLITPNQLISLAHATDQSGGIYNSDSYVELIESIKLNSSNGMFNAYTEINNLVDSVPSEEVAVLHNEFRNLGYHTKFDAIDSDTGIFTVSWSNPDFLDKHLVKKQVWSYNMISTLDEKTVIPAAELYLCQLNGVDLRSYSFYEVIKDVNTKLRQKTVKTGAKDYEDLDDDTMKYHIKYFGPNSIWSEVMSRNDGVVVEVASNSLTNLFDQVHDELEQSDYKVVIVSDALNYRWDIIWNDPPEPIPDP